MIDHASSGAVYFLDESGERWRIHDTLYTGGKHRRVTLSERRAKCPAFVRPNGERRLYLFKKDDDHSLTQELVAKQFRGSEWAANERFDSSTHGAR
jgi:hypothetical protein